MERRLKIKKFNFRTDIPALFDVINTPGVQEFVMHKPPVNTLPEFDEWLQCQLKGYFRDFYSITDVNQFNYGGCIYSYDFSNTDLNCKVTFNVSSDCNNVDMLQEIFNRFCGELFTQYPLHKIFCLAHANNAELITLLKLNKFKQEGEFKESRFVKGRLVDLQIWALNREEYKTL